MQIAALSQALTAPMAQQIITAALTATHGIHSLELAKLLLQRTLAQAMEATQMETIIAQALALAKICAVEQQEVGIAKNAAP